MLVTHQRPHCVAASPGGDDFDRDVWCVLGLPVDVADIPAAVEAVERAIRDRRRLSFVTPNVNWLVRALAEDHARRQVLNADLSLVDGAPLVVIARLLGVPVDERVAGSDLFEALRHQPRRPGRRIRVFFLGGRDGSAKAAHDALVSDPGGVEAAGWLNPGFGDVDSMSGDDVIAGINGAEPDFVVVSLGAVKGQEWIEANGHRLTAPAIAHLGAVVDFTAGSIRRAPPWLAAIGLEWCWRIAQEPPLWRRYAGDALKLARVGVSHLAPQLHLGRCEEHGEAGAVLERRAGGMVVRLSGALTRRAMRQVRIAFRQATAQGASVILDFGSTRAVDRAFLGLVLMLEKNLPEGWLEIANPSRSLRALLAANAMRYPCVELRRVREPRLSPGAASGR